MALDRVEHTAGMVLPQETDQPGPQRHPDKEDDMTKNEHPQAASDAFPSSARVVIIGGGVIGCSVAYHLTKLGWRDVVLLERTQLTAGRTWD